MPDHFDSDSATHNDKAFQVREMFASIAGRYDLLNHLLSGNIDKRWRRLLTKTLYRNLSGDAVRVLDVACGTGDLSLALTAGGNASVTGLDFCRPMLEIAADKSLKRGAKVPFIEGDALALPFGDASFDGATIAFGLRNLASVEAGLKELLRVLRPGGTVAVLEFSTPKSAVFRGLFGFYFTKLLPVVGGLLSGSRCAYEYLPDSVSNFPDQEKLSTLMRVAGFEDVNYRNLTNGVAALHLGKRPIEK